MSSRPTDPAARARCHRTGEAVAALASRLRPATVRSLVSLAVLLIVVGASACGPDPGPAREIGEVRGVDEGVPRPPAGSPLVTLETSMGEITVALYRERAPVTVENFLQYVEERHYDGTIFHRVVHDFVIQGGGFEPGMTERPTRPPIANEADNGLANLRGTLAMARKRDPDSATAQFYINLSNNRQLDPGRGGGAAGYTVFGVVVEGMDVVDAIGRVPTGTQHGRDVPRQDVVIERARRDGHVG